MAIGILVWGELAQQSPCLWVVGETRPRVVANRHLLVHRPLSRNNRFGYWREAAFRESTASYGIGSLNEDIRLIVFIKYHLNVYVRFKVLVRVTLVILCYPVFVVCGHVGTNLLNYVRFRELLICVMKFITFSIVSVIYISFMHISKKTDINIGMIAYVWKIIIYSDIH